MTRPGDGSGNGTGDGLFEFVVEGRCLDGWLGCGNRLKILSCQIFNSENLTVTPLEALILIRGKYDDLVPAMAGHRHWFCQG